MKLISEKDFFANADDRLKATLENTVLTTIKKTGSLKGDFAEGATKYSFDNTDIILVIFYSYTMITNKKPDCNYEIYYGEEIDDSILDKLNELKERTEKRGVEFIWEQH